MRSFTCILALSACLSISFGPVHAAKSTPTPEPAVLTPPTSVDDHEQVTAESGDHGLGPIAPAAPDKPFESAVKDLVDASGAKFTAVSGTASFPPETDGDLTWHLSVSRRDVPGFRNGMIRTHTNDGNVYEMGDYVEYESRDHWPAGKSDDARLVWRQVSGKIADALGPSWSTTASYHAVEHSHDVELDRKFTRSTPNFVEVRLVTDRKGNSSLVLDVSDGIH